MDEMIEMIIEYKFNIMDTHKKIYAMSKVVTHQLSMGVYENLNNLSTTFCKE